ncbi:MAG: hypothetical protein DRJ40_04970 [Thermoprotei archaeon]|nr:MAG: hypothetical protein DRJ40_04555 [Thermoprotei archaeon]RLE56751.1 MAG: hypothetical protein DRJ40_04970 [Thermoprotei archaeon]
MSMRTSLRQYLKQMIYVVVFRNTVCTGDLIILGLALAVFTVAVPLYTVTSIFSTQPVVDALKYILVDVMTPMLVMVYSWYIAETYVTTTGEVNDLRALLLSLPYTRRFIGVTTYLDVLITYTIAYVCAVVTPFWLVLGNYMVMVLNYIAIKYTVIIVEALLYTSLSLIIMMLLSEQRESLRKYTALGVCLLHYVVSRYVWALYTTALPEVDLKLTISTSALPIDEALAYYVLCNVLGLKFSGVRCRGLACISIPMSTAASNLFIIVPMILLTLLVLSALYLVARRLEVVK